jgi:hypothetical protein
MWVVRVEMDDPRITFGCLPVVSGVLLVVLGYHFTLESLQSLGSLASACGVLVLVLAALERAWPAATDGHAQAACRPFGPGRRR